MADFSKLIKDINTVIKENGRREITGQILQDVLVAMVESINEEKQDPTYGFLLNEYNPYLYEILCTNLDYEYAKEHINEIAEMGSCSAFHKDGKILRNFDWKYDERVEFIVRTKGVIGISSGVFNRSEIDYTSERAKLLPFALVDGVNSRGLYANVNVVSTEYGTGDSQPAVELRETVPALMLVRYILDNFSTAREAVEYIRDYVTIQMNGKGLHWFVTDKEGVAYTMEVIEGGVVIEEHDVLTNFHWYGVQTNADGTLYGPERPAGVLPTEANGLTPYASGIERYNVIIRNPGKSLQELAQALMYSRAYTGADWYSEFVGGDLTVDSMPSDFANIIALARQAWIQRDRETAKVWHTLHSCVYDLENKTISIVSQDGDVTIGKDPINVALQGIDYDKLIKGLVHYDIDQTLSDPQKGTARSNIGAMGFNDFNQRAVRFDQSQTLTEPQKTQARQNIGAISAEQMAQAVIVEKLRAEGAEAQLRTDLQNKIPIPEDLRDEAIGSELDNLYGVYMYKGYPCHCRTIIHNNEYKLVICAEHGGTSGVSGQKYFVYGDHADTVALENIYDSTNVPDWVKRGFGEATATASYPGLLSSDYYKKLRDLPAKAELSAMIEALRTTDSELHNEILTEQGRAEDAEAELSARIDAIVQGRDVRDIVPNYQALLDYDTTTLGDQDIIMVLLDNTKSDHTTYYRWHTDTQSWEFIGGLAFTYTKTEIDEKFADLHIVLPVFNEQSSQELLAQVDETIRHAGADAQFKLPIPVEGMSGNVTVTYVKYNPMHTYLGVFADDRSELYHITRTLSTPRTYTCEVITKIFATADALASLIKDLYNADPEEGEELGDIIKLREELEGKADKEDLKDYIVWLPSTKISDTRFDVNHTLPASMVEHLLKSGHITFKSELDDYPRATFHIHAQPGVGAKRIYIEGDSVQSINPAIAYGLNGWVYLEGNDEGKTANSIEATILVRTLALASEMSSKQDAALVSVYNHTTYDEIMAAYEAGREVVCKYGNRTYHLTVCTAQRAVFNVLAETTSNHTLVCLPNNSWLYTGTNLENSARRQSVITDSDTNYPSSKAVMNYVAEKMLFNDSAILTDKLTLKAGTFDTNKAVYDLLTATPHLAKLVVYLNTATNTYYHLNTWKQDGNVFRFSYLREDGDNLVVTRFSLDANGKVS